MKKYMFIMACLFIVVVSSDFPRVSDDNINRAIAQVQATTLPDTSMVDIKALNRSIERKLEIILANIPFDVDELEKKEYIAVGGIYCAIALSDGSWFFIPEKGGLFRIEDPPIKLEDLKQFRRAKK